MNRRDLITLFGGVAVAWPICARAQQADRVRRIGVLLPYAENDPEAKSHLSAFAQTLQRLGWSEDRNIRIDTRFAARNGRSISGARERAGCAPTRRAPFRVHA